MEEIKDIEKRLKSLEDKFKVQYEVMQEAVMSVRNPMGQQARFERMDSQIDTILKTISRVTNDIINLMTSAKYVELFTNEEIKNSYMNTDIQLKDIEKLLSQHFPDCTFTNSTVQKYVNGNCPDVHIRSFLGKYLRNEANIKAQKAKQQATAPK